MSIPSKTFHPIPGLKGIYTAHAKKLQSVAILLSNGELCVYSPLRGLSEAEFKSLDAIGNVSFLLAPNHYHHRGVADHVQRYPNAQIVCSLKAKPRLDKQTGLKFDGLDALIKHLPKEIEILEPEGLKTGEIWLNIKDKNSPAWVVCDAFSTNSPNANGFAKQPDMLGTFPKYGVRDQSVYVPWVRKQLSRTAPSILIPCHGAPVQTSDLSVSLNRLLDKYF